jgi:hypothetical protein
MTVLCAGNGQQQLTELDKHTPEVTSCFMIFRPGVNENIFYYLKGFKR